MTDQLIFNSTTHTYSSPDRLDLVNSIQGLKNRKAELEAAKNPDNARQTRRRIRDIEEALAPLQEELQKLPVSWSSAYLHQQNIDDLRDTLIGLVDRLNKKRLEIINAHSMAESLTWRFSDITVIETQITYITYLSDLILSSPNLTEDISRFNGWKDSLQKKVLAAASNPPSSSNPIRNAFDAYTTAAIADLLRDWTLLIALNRAENFIAAGLVIFDEATAQ